MITAAAVLTWSTSAWFSAPASNIQACSWSPQPCWDLTDLALHLGGIHRWALDSLAAADPAHPTAERAPATPPDAAALVAWFEQGAGELLDALQRTDPAQPCWNFGPKPRTAAFWQRRMPHESSLHAWDAARALGHPEPLDPALAADGVDEVVHMFAPRQVRLGRLEPLTDHVELRAGDVPGLGPWHLAPPGAASQDPDAVVSAPAATLLLLLWRREPLGAVVGSGELSIGGDAGVVRNLFSRPLTP